MHFEISLYSVKEGSKNLHALALDDTSHISHASFSASNSGGVDITIHSHSLETLKKIVEILS